MTRNKAYLILQAIICFLLVFLLCMSTVAIFREGTIRKAENPRDNIYTREIVAEKLSSIAPLFFVSLGLLAAGLVLNIQDENAEKPIKDSGIARDLVIGRVAKPSDAMLKEQRTQKTLLIVGWVLFALCMIPVALHLKNPANFPENDLEGMFSSLISVLLPFTVLGLFALACTSMLREKSILRETESARSQLKAEKTTGPAHEKKEPAQEKPLLLLQAVLIIAAIIFIILGVFNQSARDVLYKAITICTECVGLG